jgi:hypothetical protein
MVKYDYIQNNSGIVVNDIAVLHVHICCAVIFAFTAEGARHR